MAHLCAGNAHPIDSKPFLSMDPIASSELILRSDGSIYHLAMQPEQLARTVLTVGDPARVAMVAAHFDALEAEGTHREFRFATGRIGDRRYTVLSTGIGADNIDIALNELDALVNVNFQTRMPHPEQRRLRIVRIGTSGSLQPELPVDAFVVGSHGLGLDGLLSWYAAHRSAEDALHDLDEHAWWQDMQALNLPVVPYLVAANPELLRAFPPLFHRGVTATCPGFYAPQGRSIRLKALVPDLPAQLSRLRIGNEQVLNFEMETAPIYGLGRLLGHDCLSANVILANRIQGHFSATPKRSVERLIEAVLAVLQTLPPIE
jgi:uridine phosphorylase